MSLVCLGAKYASGQILCRKVLLGRYRLGENMTWATLKVKFLRSIPHSDDFSSRRVEFEVLDSVLERLANTMGGFIKLIESCPEELEEESPVNLENVPILSKMTSSSDTFIQFKNLSESLIELILNSKVRLSKILQEDLLTSSVESSGKQILNSILTQLRQFSSKLSKIDQSDHFGYLNKIKKSELELSRLENILNDKSKTDETKTCPLSRMNHFVERTMLIFQNHLAKISEDTFDKSKDQGENLIHLGRFSKISLLDEDVSYLHCQ